MLPDKPEHIQPQQLLWHKSQLWTPVGYHLPFMHLPDTVFSAASREEANVGKVAYYPPPDGTLSLTTWYNRLCHLQFNGYMQALEEGNMVIHVLVTIVL